jgi:hypothetical protein
MNPSPGTTKPPSPNTGSATIAAMASGPIWLRIVSMARSAQASPHRSGDAPAGQR